VALLALMLLALAVAAHQAAGQPAEIEKLHAAFTAPPDDSRIMMRWWWFGPAATKPEITRELEAMQAAGIGGVEIANLYALGLDDPAAGFRNTPFLSDEHLDALRFAAQEARRLGLRVDVTLGSGWPFGGPEIPVTQAAGKLRVEALSISAGATSVQAPFVDAGEEMLAAFLPADPGSDKGGPQEIALPASGWFHLTAASEPRTLICFLSSRSGMAVKRPAVGAAGFVLDHYDSAAIEAHLHAVGDRLLSAFGDQPPYAVFSDSLEDYGSDWSLALLAEFEQRRGYDLRPHLLALVQSVGPETEAIRHDWGRTLTEMANDHFLAPMHAWAADAKTQYYSGQATYRKSFELPQRELEPGSRLFLDFGTGTPEKPPSPPGEHNMKAYLEAPIREAAQVFVNGKLAGSVWRPPYRLDVTELVHEGANELRIVVGNTAINALAGQPLPDYRLLWNRYGKLFEPQDMHDLHPLPSGMLGPVTLIQTRTTKQIKTQIK
jgi:hypothetical protein